MAKNNTLVQLYANCQPIAEPLSPYTSHHPNALRRIYTSSEEMK